MTVRMFTIFQPNGNRFTISDINGNKLVSNLKLPEFERDLDSANLMLNQVVEELNKEYNGKFNGRKLVDEFLKMYAETFGEESFSISGAEFNEEGLVL